MQTKKFLMLVDLLKTDYSAKITEIESKIPSTSGLATNSALTAVENKIPDISNLVKKKTDYDAKIIEIEKKITDHNYGKYITTSEFNNLTAKKFSARLAQANLVTKTDFDTKLISLNKELTQIKQNMYLLKMKLESYKHLIQVIFVRKIILKMMVLKII